MNIGEKLLSVQTELNVPKGQVNKFANYKYRSAEDILEALKPVCKKHKVVIKITETLKAFGNLLYVESTAKMIDTEDVSQQIESVGTAIIEFNAKGMQMPQKTGAASSYAKKYALGNLLMIDDTKDADATNDHKETKPSLPAGGAEYDKVVEYLKKGGSIAKVTAKYEVSKELMQTLKSI